MRKKMSCFAVVLVAGAMGSVTSMACSLEASDPVVIKQMMAKEIAYRLGIQAQQIPLGQITEPISHTPLGLGADCSGLGAYHSSSGFRIRVAASLEPARAQSPASAPKTTPLSAQQPQSPAGSELNEFERQLSPGVCSYEGVAVLLGYDYSSPVAVNFMRQCG